METTQDIHTKLLVKAILERPYDYEWSLQGFGMLRMYLAPEVRLHVWDSRFAVPNVSEMHTHPWDFWSYVVAGELDNFRYREDSRHVLAQKFYRQKILCGVGGGLTNCEPEIVQLPSPTLEHYTAGDSYRQWAEEIHVSKPVDGTVTIVTREFQEDKDHAYVFWPLNQEWISAEPRKAEYGEVQMITENSLKTWFE